MIKAKVTCPSCRAVLATPTPVPAGQTAVCPKCGARFRLPVHAAEAVAPPPAAPVAA